MKNVLILGTGNIGFAASLLLKHSGDYAVSIAGRNKTRLETIATTLNLPFIQVDIENKEKLTTLFTGFDAVISALPFYLNTTVAKAALVAKCSYFDFTEDVQTTKEIQDIAKQANKQQVFAPQCGLAPGFISVLAYDLFKQFEKVDSVKMRVGALPKYPSNQILYNLTWSTDGLINEYCNPCSAIKEGTLIQVEALEGLEKFSLDGLEYEAFNTSGGLGSLCESLDGKVNALDYKTIRYKGHRELMHFLINGLCLGEKERRAILKDVLEYAIPVTKQDVVLIFCSVTGERDGKKEQLTNVRKIYDEVLFNTHLSSIQITTAAGLCAVVDLVLMQTLRKQGFLKQEEISLEMFLQNRFGKYYLQKE